MKNYINIIKIFVAIVILSSTVYAYQSTEDSQIADAAIATKASKNYYTKYQCTWYVFNKRTQAKKYIHTNWGNAKYWASAAKRSGYKVGRKPVRGAIMQSTVGYYGHVAYVEHVYSNGSVKVSEYNYNRPLRYGTRILTKSAAAQHHFIY